MTTKRPLEDEDARLAFEAKRQKPLLGIKRHPRLSPEQFKKRHGASDKTANGMPNPPTSSATSWKSARSAVSKIPGRPSDEFMQDRQTMLEDSRKKLPIWQNNRRPDLIWELRFNSNVIIVVGETGSGKSTQVPQFLMLEKWNERKHVKIVEDGREKEIVVGGLIGVTEPRRVAVTSLAYRVAAESGCHIGKGMTFRDWIGYSIRFDTVSTPNQKVKFLTEGMLLQEMTRDPYLRKYSAIIIDEIHERSTDVDLLAGLIKDLTQGTLKGRGGIPLKVVIMSATADVELLQKFFEEPLVVHSTSIEVKTDNADKTTGTVGSERGIVEEENLVAVKSKSSSSNDAKAKSKKNAEKNAKSSVSAVKTGHGGGRKNKKHIKFDESEQAVAVRDFETNSISSSTSFEGFSESSENVAPEISIPVAAKLSPAGQESESKPIKVLYVEGRQHKVEVFYEDEPIGSDYCSAMEKQILEVNMRQAMPGDILCFLPGQEDIESVTSHLQSVISQQVPGKRKTEIPQLEIVPLFGQQSMEDQQRAFAAAGKGRRKVILATNVAETSITVPGVKYVIDSGKAKIKEFRPTLNIDSLLIKDISKSSAKQRMGRAGRLENGKCWRLYTKKEFEARSDNDIPEVERSNLTSTVLRMKAMGIKDPHAFNWLTPPPQEAIIKAHAKLLTLGAIDETAEITSIGRTMNKFPIAPGYARVLIDAAAAEDSCILEAIDVIAILTSSEDIFLHFKTEEEEAKYEEMRRDIRRSEGDILTYLTAIRSYIGCSSSHYQWCKDHGISAANMKTAMNIRKQLLNLCYNNGLLSSKEPSGRQEFTPPTEEKAKQILKSFMTAFVDQTAMIHPDGKYHSIHGDKSVIFIHPTSTLRGKRMEAIMYLEHVFTSKNFAKKVSKVQASWIEEALTMKWS